MQLTNIHPFSNEIWKFTSHGPINKISWYESCYVKWWHWWLILREACVKDFQNAYSSVLCSKTQEGGPKKRNLLNRVRKCTCVSEGGPSWEAHCKHTSCLSLKCCLSFWPCTNPLNSVGLPVLFSLNASLARDSERRPSWGPFLHSTCVAFGHEFHLLLPHPPDIWKGKPDLDFRRPETSWMSVILPTRKYIQCIQCSLPHLFHECKKFSNLKLRIRSTNVAKFRCVLAPFVSSAS